MTGQSQTQHPVANAVPRPGPNLLRDWRATFFAPVGDGQRRRHVLPQPDDPDRDDFLDELFPGRPVVIDGRGLDPASSPTSASRIPA